MIDLKRLSAVSRDLPLCRRCMLEDLEEGTDIALALHLLIDAIPPEKRAGKVETDRRLDICRRCDHLLSGTCALCGCYVALRASRASSGCPDVPDRWKA